MNNKKDQRRNLLLPWFLVDLYRFLFEYKVLRAFDRVKLVVSVLVRWLIVFYIPIWLWLLGNLLNLYWAFPIKFVENIIPAFVSCLPLPFFESSEPGILNVIQWVLIDLAWLFVGLGTLNTMVAKSLNGIRIEALWRKACLYIGLVTKTNLGKDETGKDYPEILSATDRTFHIQAKGFTPDAILQKRLELSGAMGLWIGDITYAKTDKGEMIPHVIQINYSRSDLPSMIRLQDMPMLKTPCFGFSRNGWQAVKPEDWPHILVSGTTGAGKSVGLRSLILQLMVYYPNSVVVGADFKAGAEFRMFTSNQNFLLVTEPDEFIRVLMIVFQEYKRRAELLSHSNVDNLYQMGIDPLFVVIDEAAECFDKTLIGKSELEQLIGYVDKLARLGRATAIHLILATQKATVTDAGLPSRVKSMLQLRIMYRVEDLEDSKAVVGTGIGTKLPDVSGRAYLKQGKELVEIQTPFISKDDAKQILNAGPATVVNPLMIELRKATHNDKERIVDSCINVLGFYHER